MQPLSAGPRRGLGCCPGPLLTQDKPCRNSSPFGAASAGRAGQGQLGLPRARVQRLCSRHPVRPWPRAVRQQLSAPGWWCQAAAQPMQVLQVTSELQDH